MIEPLGEEGAIALSKLASSAEIQGGVLTPQQTYHKRGVALGPTAFVADESFGFRV